MPTRGAKYATVRSEDCRETATVARLRGTWAPLRLVTYCSFFRTPRMFMSAECDLEDDESLCACMNTPSDPGDVAGQEKPKAPSSLASSCAPTNQAAVTVMSIAGHCSRSSIR